MMIGSLNHDYIDDNNARPVAHSFWFGSFNHDDEKLLKTKENHIHKRNAQR